MVEVLGVGVWADSVRGGGGVREGGMASGFSPRVSLTQAGHGPGCHLTPQVPGLCGASLWRRPSVACPAEAARGVGGVSRGGERMEGYGVGVFGVRWLVDGEVWGFRRGERGEKKLGE